VNKLKKGGRMSEDTQEQVLEFPTLERQLDFLNRQADEMRMANFRNDVAAELYEQKIAIAKEANDKESIRKYEEELEEIEKANKGNNLYLELLKKRIG
jgi:hypothetical protein